MAICKFREEYYFLSNFYMCGIDYKGLHFSSAEAAFQSQKCPERAEEFVGLNPKESKQHGRTVELREDWEQVKFKIMSENVLAKFLQNPRLRKQLLETGDELLIERNNWNDTYWGICKGIGKNRLGHILMKVRTVLKEVGY